ncbi:ribonuclease H [Trifolium pratense]|uniref:Ribonuclease H n=1 Tax=Trifolium pratense TaxID=57577 RepID=A0A2K3M1I6_TRIPR|nr:ribonuclease H [Trifolium pratense]
MSGLKINFNKSMLVGVNIPATWLGEAALALSCRVRKIHFLYPGLPNKGDPRRLGFWELVLDRLKNCLFGWKSRFLSFGGRLVLLKSVLTSLSVYALSFIKAPSGVWGFGVRRLREFNLALLGKWCWRMLMDREGLWFRVLVARYGVERGRLRGGGLRGSAWWRELERIWDGGGDGGGGWFREQRFGRLFDLLENKSTSVAEMYSLGWGQVDHMAVTVRPGYRLYSPWCLPVIDGSGCGYFGCCGRFYLALSGSFEALLVLFDLLSARGLAPLWCLFRLFQITLFNFLVQLGVLVHDALYMASLRVGCVD